MNWVVLSPYFETPNDRWISDSVTGGRHRFELVPALGGDRNWHQASAQAGIQEWVNRLRQARRGFGSEVDGVITVFPQLAAAAGAWKRSRGDDRPVVAWLFNTEGLNSPVRRRVAKVALGQIDRFVVHSTAEIGGYAGLLRLPVDRFEFVPLQYGAPVETERPLEAAEPYVFATGSGYRDYPTFFAAMKKLGYRTLVLASDRALAGTVPPSNVTILEQLTRPEIRRLVRHARVNVVPLNDEALTAGLVTIVETFRHGRSVVTTDRPGLDDYCVHDQTALCATLFDPTAMAESIEAMWSDAATRERLDEAAGAFAEANCTDEAAGAHLVRILDSVS